MNGLRQLLVSRWPLWLALVFSAYSWALLAQLFDAQRQLRQDAEQQKIALGREHASFFDVLLNDLQLRVQAVAESPEIGNYLINRNLGMSLRYGLGTNIFDIQERLGRLSREQDHRGAALFERLVYVDEQGRRVAETGGGALPQALLSKEAVPAGLWVDQDSRRFVIHAPVRVQGQWGGTVIGMAGFDRLYGTIRDRADDARAVEILLDANGQEIPHSADQRQLDDAIALELARLPENQLVPVVLPEGYPLAGSWIATTHRVRDKPLLSVHLFRQEAIDGHLVSRGLLYGATIVPFLIILFALMYQRMRTVGKALEYSRKRFETVFEHISDAILLLPVDEFRILEVNPRMLAMFGYSRDEIVRLDISALSAEEVEFSAERWLEFQRRTCDNGLQLFPWRARRRDGALFWVEVSLMRAPIDESERILVLMHDITHSKTLEQDLRDMLTYQQALNKKLEDTQGQLLQSEKMASVGQLAAGIAHEINNPIGFIKANVGSLRTYTEGCFRLIDAYEQEDAAHSEAIRRLRSELDYDFWREDCPVMIRETIDGIERVSKIVLDLRDFSHIDNEEWEYADLHRGIESSLNVVWNELKHKADVIRDYGDLPSVECLPGQINQVVMNLLINAAHAIPERGQIHVRTGQEGDEVWIEVADSGCGISPANLSRVFDPFFTTKPVGKGTGLGLSLSYGIMKKHRGRISVESVEGQGSRFRIHLPVEHREPQAAG